MCQIANSLRTRRPKLLPSATHMLRCLLPRPRQQAAGQRLAQPSHSKVALAAGKEGRHLAAPHAAIPAAARTGSAWHRCTIELALWLLLVVVRMLLLLLDHRPCHIVALIIR